jgi:ADYC domain
MSRTIPLVTSWFLCGCVVGEDNFTPVEQTIITPNGISPNGISPNGISPNGVSLNGISPNGISPNGTPIGVAGAGAPLSGPGIVGSTWTGYLSDGTTAVLRIEDALQGTGANADVWSYLLSISADGTWRPLCLDPAGDPIFADSVPGSWNLTQGVPGGGSYQPEAAELTLACRGSAIAKCVELGYKPWTGHAGELVTCVRALRGDYCGDGTPYTVNGTLVNLYDAAGIQPDGAAWDPEAEWTPSGADCISKKKEARFSQVANERPWCYPHALQAKKSCGTGFTAGVEIITELSPL